MNLSTGEAAVNEATPQPVVSTLSAPPKRRRRSSALVWQLVLGVILMLSILLAIGLGSYPVAIDHVLEIIAHHTVARRADTSILAAEHTVVWRLRVPRVLVAALVGASLAAAGAALQAVVRNTLADPYLVGVSSGASFGAALVITTGLGSLIGVVTLTAGAFVGAVLAIVMVLALASGRRNLHSGRLILAGIAISFFLSAATNLVVVLSDSRDAVRAVLFWTLGSLSRAGWADVGPLTATTLACVLVLTTWSRRLDAVALGDDVASSLGTEPSRLRVQVVLLSSLGVAAAVSVAGSIGFIGLVVPHLARRLVGATHRVVIPASALIGGVLLVWADTLARTALAPREIPLGILTALVGTPLLMALVRRQLNRPTST